MKLATLTAATAALIAAVTALPAIAADLGDGRGSVKDGYRPVMPMHGPVSSCYFRGDVGGSFSADPDISWPITSGGNFITDKVTNASVDNTWLIETGVGCGSGSRGLRGEFVLGYRGQRSIDGTTGPWTGLTTTANADLSSSLTSYTAMINGYYDLGRYGGFVPYVGAGIGVAYHQMHEVSFANHPDLTGIIAGDNDIAFAWSLMAGVAYQLSDRAILDFGYRYVDLGSAASARHNNGGTFTDPKVVVGDITAHEIKVGLRYHIGQGSCCIAPMPLK